MKGSITYMRDRNRWRLIWYDEKAHKYRNIDKYNGQYMPCSAFKMKGGALVFDKAGRPIPDKDKCHGYALAVKLKSLMQGRWEQARRGECQFRIEEFTKSGWTDTIEYFQKFIDEYISKRRKPATVKAYRSYSRNWIEPFFTKHPIRLHEIEHDTLIKFQNFIVNGLKANNPDGNIGKTALNVMSALRRMMRYAHKSKRIPTMPPFPELEDYNLKKPKIKWLTREEWESVYARIPEVNRPIFDWLRLHYRRPGEACALYKSDYDAINDAFTVQRAISARKLVDSVKTNWQRPGYHRIPCDPSFTPIAKKLLNENLDSPFLFVNPRARKDGGRYTLEAIRNVWYKACDDAGIDRIWPYQGTKHTACTNFIEEGGTIEELRYLTDHATLKSVEQYAELTLERKRKAQAAAKEREEIVKQIREKHQSRHIQDTSKVIQLPLNRK